jgi:hypothetical protein
VKSKVSISGETRRRKWRKSSPVMLMAVMPSPGVHLDGAIDKKTSFAHLGSLHQYRSIRNYDWLQMRNSIPGMLKKVAGDDK